MRHVPTTLFAIVWFVTGCASSKTTPAASPSERPAPEQAMQAQQPPAAVGMPDPVNAQAGTMASTPSRSTPATVAVCTTGATRSCCGKGTQTCSGIEFVAWGPCVDQAGGPLSCVGCTTESEQSCDAGTPETDAGQLRDAGSDAGVDAGDSCGPDMVCRPSSIRYCDESSIAEWTVSTCSKTGQWSACAATTIPKELDGVGDCTATSYSPESCCPQQMLCCQDGLGGIFDPWGGDACDALTCP